MFLRTLHSLFKSSASSLDTSRLTHTRINHFKDVFLRTDSKVVEKMVTDEKTGEEYVALQSKCWKQSISTHASLKVDGDSATPQDLIFGPYYFRANRGGKGQMRVGLMNGGIESGFIFPERL
mgnify:CR=1 FL=1